MIVIASYVVAFIVTMIVTNIAYLFLLPFKPIISRHLFFAPIAQFLVATTGAFGAVFIYVVIAENSSLKLAYFILLLPALFLLWNNIKRVSRAKDGTSKMREIVEANGEIYNQKVDIQSEQAAEAGHAIGYLLGVSLLLHNASFFM